MIRAGFCDVIVSTFRDSMKEKTSWPSGEILESTTEPQPGPMQVMTSTCKCRSVSKHPTEIPTSAGDRKAHQSWKERRGRGACGRSHGWWTHLVTLSVWQPLSLEFYSMQCESLGGGETQSLCWLLWSDDHASSMVLLITGTSVMMSMFSAVGENNFVFPVLSLASFVILSKLPLWVSVLSFL